MKRWLRYGIIGNLLSYGVGVGFMAYFGNLYLTKHGSFTTSAKTKVSKWTKTSQNN